MSAKAANRISAIRHVAPHKGGAPAPVALLAMATAVAFAVAMLAITVGAAQAMV
jgi:phosphotransacetylase